MRGGSIGGLVVTVNAGVLWNGAVQSEGWPAVKSHNAKITKTWQPTDNRGGCPVLGF